MDIRVDGNIIRAFDSYKKKNKINSNYKLAKDLGVAESTISGWYNRPNTTIRANTWEKIGGKIEPFIDDSISGSDEIVDVLEVYENEESLDYVVASLAERLSKYTSLVPPKFENLTGEKKEAVKLILENIAKLIK